MLVVGAVALPVATPTAAQDLAAGEPAGTAAGNAARFSDPRGDAIPGGLDIASVALSHGAGKLAFAIAVPSHPTLPGRKGLNLLLDTDRRANTGPLGAEYRIFVEPGGDTGLDRWDASQDDWFGVPGSLQAASYVRGTWAGEIRLSSLRGVSAFNFIARTFDRTPSGDSVLNDRAPNSGIWSYQLTTTQKPRPQPVRKLLFASVKPRPDPPVAGQRFTIEAVVWRQPPWSGVFRGRALCKAEIGSQPARVASLSVGPDRAACTVDIPATAAGKSITGSLTVSEASATLRRDFAWRIVAPRPTISIAEIKTVPARGPQAGEVFYYGMKIGIVSASGAPRRITAGKVTCRATIEGKALEVIRAEVVPADAAMQCGWDDLPRTASGKTLLGSLVLRSERPTRLTFTHTFKLRVR